MSEAHVRSLVANYLAERITLEELDGELSPIPWNATASDSLKTLVNAIELRIDEYSSGTCDAEQLRQAFLPFVTDYEANLIVGAPATLHVQTGLSSELVRTRLTTAHRVTDNRW